MKRDDLSVFIPHVIESVFFEIQINERKTIIVGVVYRPNTQPRADIDIFMQKIIEIQSKIKEENKVSYLIVHGPDKISVPPKVAKLQWYKIICYTNIS